MFELRLGLALGRSQGEVRALPAPEYRRWQLFYLLEPWGWPDAEYRTAAVLAQQHNIYRGDGNTKEPSDFMRDMATEIIKQLEGKNKLDEMSFEEKRAYIIAAIRRDFGASR